MNKQQLEYLQKYNMTEESWRKAMSDIRCKMNGINDLDWNEIAKNNRISCSYESIRKSSQGPFGGKFVYDVLTQDGFKSRSQMEKVRGILGEQYIVKQQIHNEKVALNRIKRDFVKSLSIADELKQYMSDNNFRVIVPESCLSTYVGQSRYEMIVHISDWHIGCIIKNCNGNSFNLKIAENRINKLLFEVKRYIKLYDVKKVYVINTGDVVEHTYMRKTQSECCEFPQSKQINHVIDLLFKFLCGIVEIPGVEVEYDSVAGNHDRMNGDKAASLEDDNVETIITHQLQKYTKLSEMTRLHIVEREYCEKDISKNINGLNVKIRHGHDIVKDEKRQIKNDISMDEEFYDLLLLGHLHNHRVISENNGRYIECAGCLSGFNPYSKRFGCTTVASQTIIVTDKNKVELIKDVQLQ